MFIGPEKINVKLVRLIVVVDTFGRAGGGGAIMIALMTTDSFHANK